MAEVLEVYPLVLRAGRWWFPFGREATAESLADVWRSDCQVVFLGPSGGSLAYDVDEAGQEVVRLDYGAWVPLEGARLTPWQNEALGLVLAAVEEL